MESITTHDYLEKFNSLDDYVSVKKDTINYLNLPKSINNKYFSIFKKNQNQINSSYFFAKLKNILLLCGDNGISGTTFKTKNNFFIDDINPYWSESIGIKCGITYHLYNEPSIYIGQKWGGYNLYHFLFTSLTKLIVCDIYNDINLNSTKIIHNSIKPKFIREIFELLNIELENIICLDDHPCLLIDDLRLSSPIGYGVNANKESCFILKLLFKKYINYNPYRNIYIHRSKNRSIINEDEILKILDYFNFEIIKLEDLSFIEQIKIFSESKNIIAPHGAGLSNLVWSKEGTKVLEIFSPTYMGLCYWLVADSCNLDYYYLIGSGKYDDKSDYWYSNGSSNIKIDLEEFKLTLDLMGII